MASSSLEMAAVSPLPQTPRRPAPQLVIKVARLLVPSSPDDDETHPLFTSDSSEEPVRVSAANEVGTVRENEAFSTTEWLDVI